MKPALKLLVPPILIMAIHRLRASVHRSASGALSLDLRPAWEVVPTGWRRDDGGAAGWRHASIIETERRAWESYQRLIQGKGPLGLYFFAIGAIADTDENAHNVLMTFAYVVARAAQGRRRISILDWGGGIGYYALVAQSLLPELDLDYVIKELPELSSLGRELMPTVSFETDEKTCLSRRYDLVMASSSIQYAEDWQALLGDLAAASTGWLFVTRVPTVRRARSFVVVQRPHQFGYHTEYISWVLNRDEFLDRAASLGLTLEREFLAGGTTRIHRTPETAENRGFLFRAPDRGQDRQKSSKSVGQQTGGTSTV